MKNRLERARDDIWVNLIRDTVLTGNESDLDWGDGSREK